MKSKVNLKKSTWLVCTSFVFCLFLSAAMVGEASAARNFVRFGGSNPGGSWFTIVGGMTALFNKDLPDLNVSPVATGGSTDNNRQARHHNLDMWLTHSITAYDNWTGTGLFKGQGAYKGFRMLAGVYESWHHFVVLEKSHIKTIEDLKGKRVAVGPAGSGAAANAQLILGALGIWDKIKPLYLPFNACGRALGDGQADAISMSSAPMPAIVTLAALHKLRLIALTKDEMNTVVKKYPAYKESIMPAGVYKWWKKPYPCIAFGVYWVAQKDLNPDWVYQIMKVAFDPKNANFLARVHPQLKTLAPDFNGMLNMGIPLQAGAIKYYKEKGMNIPAQLIENQ